jgi:hypothetical protein
MATWAPLLEVTVTKPAAGWTVQLRVAAKRAVLIIAIAIIGFVAANDNVQIIVSRDS